MKVYVCSSLRPEVMTHRNAVIAGLAVPEGTRLFLPDGVDPTRKREIVREDVYEIETCDEFWIVGQYGRDCAWEVGYAMALNKKIKFFLDATNENRFNEDWMIMTGYDKGIMEVIKL